MAEKFKLMTYGQAKLSFNGIDFTLSDEKLKAFEADPEVVAADAETRAVWKRDMIMEEFRNVTFPAWLEKLREAVRPLGIDYIEFTPHEELFADADGESIECFGGCPEPIEKI